jgi:hypothetical protein
MKKLTLMLILLLVGLVSQLQAGPTTGISVTVTLELVSVSVASTSWAIGSVAAESSKESGTYTVTNDGNVTENISIQCGNSASWTVVGTISAPNQFKMEAKGGDFLVTYTSIDSSKVLKSSLAASGTVTDLKLNFTAPQAGSNTTAQTIPITLTASKSS